MAEYSRLHLAGYCHLCGASGKQEPVRFFGLRVFLEKQQNLPSFSESERIKISIDFHYSQKNPIKFYSFLIFVLLRFSHDFFISVMSTRDFRIFGKGEQT